MWRYGLYFIVFFIGNKWMDSLVYIGTWFHKQRKRKHVQERGDTRVRYEIIGDILNQKKCINNYKIDWSENNKIDRIKVRKWINLIGDEKLKKLSKNTIYTVQIVDSRVINIAFWDTDFLKLCYEKNKNTRYKKI